MLNAHDAKILTAEALAPDAEIIKPYLQNLDGLIKSAAKRGKNEITHPFDGIKIPDSQVVKIIRKQIEQLGFVWEDHPDPGPRHPGSGPYTTVSW
jgi:hypothetical protein